MNRYFLSHFLGEESDKIMIRRLYVVYVLVHVIYCLKFILDSQEIFFEKGCMCDDTRCLVAAHSRTDTLS